MGDLNVGIFSDLTPPGLVAKPQNPPLDPYKTILVLKHNGKEVGRIPAKAPNAEAYVNELTGFYKSLQIDYEPDPTGGLLYALHAK